jgi:hypothetical protein
MTQKLSEDKGVWWSSSSRRCKGKGVWWSSSSRRCKGKNVTGNIFPVTFLSLLWPDDDHLVGRNMSPFN